MSPPLAPGLYIVATPIGNLSDLSPRAAAVLVGCDVILAEDKRVTAKLLRHVGATAPMRIYNDHSSEAERTLTVMQLREKSVALVSDAGTPLISDPGYKLVRAARVAGHAITTIPGPCAAIAALTLSGLPSDRFLFVGFLPPKSVARSAEIAPLAAIDATLIFYESGHRLGSCLGDLARLLGPRDAAVAREITKLHEECVTGTLDELTARYSDESPKGEIVVVVGPPAEAAAPNDDAIDRALVEAMKHDSPSRAAAKVAEALGIPRKRTYARALELGGRG